ncbi:FluG domain-containing protein [Triangularia setosa]|uniref:FluG domain-containing protein n=1 Tax=Triangularia setosa TaxID=2587417 RepID=A0AAN7A2I2_9PEZI|nr:FluG domain-containing protein [Podospora setosa]
MPARCNQGLMMTGLFINHFHFEMPTMRHPHESTNVSVMTPEREFRRNRFLQSRIHFGLHGKAAQLRNKINIAGMLQKWKRPSDGDGFLDYLCQICRIKSWGASWEYFRQYKQLYASVTGRYMDRNNSLEVKKLHDAVLIRRYDLQPPCNRGKDVANVDTLLVLQTFNIKYDTGIFSWERHRIQLSGCYLGLAFTGARPAEFVDGERKSSKNGCLEELFTRHATGSPSCDEDKAPMISQECESRGHPKVLCYEDILLMVVRHPKSDEDALAMSIKFVLSQNDLCLGADNKPKPTIFFFSPTRRLIFCFISVIVSLAVHDSAFAASKFTSVRAVFQVRNRGPIKCTPLRWKEEWLKRPVFRRHDDSYRPLLYQKLYDDMERQSLDAGEENAIEPKAWRRGAANAVNGSASDAVRDQMMRHDPKWATFNSAYINEKVGFHLQNAFLDEPTEDGLLAILSHIGLMRDPRASKDMVPDERAQLKGGQYRIKGSEREDRVRELTKLIAAKEAQRKKAIRQAYREDYFHNRPTWDIDTDGQEEDEYLAQILCNQPNNLSSGKLLELRIQAAELMVVLCGKRETVKRTRIRRRAQVNVAVEESLGPEAQATARRREADCRGKALEFKHLNHFKNHVEVVHGLKLRA